MNLQNATSIDELDPKGAKMYNINGQEVHGYFGLDYPAQVIFDNVTRESTGRLCTNALVCVAMCYLYVLLFSCSAPKHFPEARGI